MRWYLRMKLYTYNVMHDQSWQYMDYEDYEIYRLAHKVLTVKSDTKVHLAADCYIPRSFMHGKLFTNRWFRNPMVRLHAARLAVRWQPCYWIYTYHITRYTQEHYASRSFIGACMTKGYNSLQKYMGHYNPGCIQAQLFLWVSHSQE